MCESFDSYPLRDSFKFGDREVEVRGRKSWDGLTVPMVLKKAQPRASPYNIPNSNQTLLPLPTHLSFQPHCHSRMLLMLKKQAETEPTRPRLKELIKATKAETPSQKEFNQSLEIIKELEFIYLQATAVLSHQILGCIVRNPSGSGF